jgi:hypothetical protein
MSKALGLILSTAKKKVLQNIINTYVAISYNINLDNLENL